MTTTHLAGVAIRIGEDLPKGQPGRLIQRCSICGYKLTDTINSSMPLNPDGSANEWPAWQTGALVQITPGNPEQSMVIEPEEEGKLPKDGCLILVEP